VRRTYDYETAPFSLSLGCFLAADSSLPRQGRVLRRREGEELEVAMAAAAAAGVVNYPLVSALLAFAVAQSSKVFTTW